MLDHEDAVHYTGYIADVKAADSEVILQNSRELEDGMSVRMLTVK